MKKFEITKKTQAALVSGLIGVFALTGCGASDAATQAQAKDADPTPAAVAEATEETVEEAQVEETAATTEETVTIKIGANLTPHAEILRQAAPILEKEGVILDIVEIEDSVTPNVGVADGSLDANYFQHQPYLDEYNAQNGTDIVSVGAIHYEPFGIYAGKTASLEDLTDGAVVAVPNNVTNEARALLLLEQENLITLKEDVGINATVNDITENPKNLKIEEIAPEQLVRALPDVDIAIINGNYAIEGGLKVADALAVEANDGLAAETYGNIVAAKSEKADDEALKKLVTVLQSKEIADYINNTYGGAVVPLN
jgi:D-methionine transport system substrate-binding protein